VNNNPRNPVINTRSVRIRRGGRLVGASPVREGGMVATIKHFGMRHRRG
jgi:hypothetical protein